MASPEYWLITVPNRGDAVEVSLNKLARATAAFRAEAPANPHRVDVPNLVVGTLDSLMALSDDLVKVDFQIESLVKRVERQYHEVENKKAGDELKVGGQPVDRYIANFNWEHAKYPQRRTLPELVALIQSGTAKIEEELKALSAAYAEKGQAVAALKRKKGGSLMTAPLEEVLTEEHVKGKEFLNTEFLLTLVVVVPKNLEKEWLETYSTIGADIAAYNNPDWASGIKMKLEEGKVPSAERAKVKGSPVVPGSTAKLFEDGEACLYTVTVLKGQYESGFFTGEEYQNGVFIDYVEDFKNKAREKRFIARNFTFDPAAADNARTALDRAQIDSQQMLAQLIKWCKAHYGEAMTAWMHVKIIRTFVEAVLRFGLPVDFLTAITRPKAKKEKALHQALETLYADLATDTPKVAAGGPADPDDKEGDDTPCVLNKFNPLAATG